jgi:hypothetical protein
VALKRKYDPDNLLRMNSDIKPAGRSAAEWGFSTGPLI